MNKTVTRPQLTAYESVLLICAALALRGKTIVRHDTLIQILYQNKGDLKTKVLFVDVAFRKTIDTVTSVDIEDSLIKLQTYGAIGKLNPAYEKIIIYIRPEEAKDFLSAHSPEIQEAANRISEDLVDV